MTWYDVLKAARRAAAAGNRKEAVFTAAGVAAQAKIKPTDRSSADAIASAWLCKFLRWGYVLRAGTQGGKGRPRTLFVLTDWGRRCRPGSKRSRKAVAGRR